MFYLLFLQSTFLKMQKKKKKQLLGTWKIHIKYSSAEQSTLQKINNQRLHYFCLLRLEVVKQFLAAFLLSTSLYNISHAMFRGIIDMLLITEAGLDIPVIPSCVWEQTSTDHF